MTVTTLWERIERELEAQFPHVLATLNPGASEEEIIAVEQALGIGFLDDFRESLSRHNGQNDKISLVGRGRLLPLEEILSEWQREQEIYQTSTYYSDHYCISDPGVRPVWWHTRWIPITTDWGDHDCLDHAPAPGGTHGQVIEHWHDDARRSLRAQSFKEKLEKLAEALEQKNLTWNGRSGPEEHWFWRIFDRLTTWELYELMYLRQKVFVVEQNCVYLDADGYDQVARHLLGRDEHQSLVASLRLFAPGGKYKEFPEDASIGRVCTAASVRGTGLGRELMRRGIAEAERLWPGCAIRISAQVYLEKFYGSLGFVAVSAPYDEDGIPHVEMARPAKIPDTVQ
ncbi:GNAT family N-acetyltransferase [Armatimonas sp.]|uniref:GNAT family N-acetyltransferase n=1 Tax=Armatimonas sp. TaxID=1872638 RepID=UPI0037503753